ncbi:MAG: AAA family ATPase [Sphingomonas sp.]
MDEIAPTPLGDAPLSRFDYRMRNPIPTTRYIQPCAGIEPEPTDGSSVFTSVADRYVALTRRLPLAGASVMKLDRHNDIAITRHLRDEAPWLATAIDRIDAQLRLQLWAGRPWIAFRPLLLTGPPGCGKSHLARVIGQGASTGHAVLDLAGISDARTIEGTARGWTSTQPCFPAIAMKQAMTANPVLTLEEIDKAGGSARNGDPLSVILTMIERSTARRYYDKCLMAPVDLSYVNWVMTANDASRLPAPLRSRLDIVEVTGPGPEHFDALAANILRDLAKDWEVPVTALPTIEPSVEQIVRQRFHGHRSVRRLAREIEAVLAALIPFEPTSRH